MQFWFFTIIQLTQNLPPETLYQSQTSFVVISQVKFSTNIKPIKYSSVLFYGKGLSQLQWLERIFYLLPRASLDMHTSCDGGPARKAENCILHFPGTWKWWPTPSLAVKVFPKRDGEAYFRLLEPLAWCTHNQLITLEMQKTFPSLNTIG